MERQTDKKTEYQERVSTLPKESMPRLKSAKKRDLPGGVTYVGTNGRTEPLVEMRA